MTKTSLKMTRTKTSLKKTRRTYTRRVRARALALVAPASCSVLLGIGVLSGPAGAVAQETYPVPGAVYSAGVETPAGATLAVFGGVSGHGGDFASASAQALATVESLLGVVGLGKENVVRVRAALAPGSGAGAEFAGWNEAWTDFFDTGYLPARTTVGSSGLPDDARIVLDVVAVFPSDAGYPARVDGARETPNPNIRLAGPADNPIALVSTRSGLFFSSGVLPGRNDVQNPESMEEQIRSSMNRLTSTLADHGLRWHDVFFVRVLPTPQEGRQTPDFEGWAPVFTTLGEVTGGHAPAYSMWAAPGFGSSGRYVEIEVWAVPHGPQAPFATFDQDRPNPLLQMSGSPTSSIASGATIAPNAELVWISGVIAPDGTSPEGEAAGALAQMKERLAAMDLSMSDVAELRVYRVAGDEEADLSGAWNEAYGAEFASDMNPHRPVRTNYLVESLPGRRHVEVEAVLVRPPTGF